MTPAARRFVAALGLVVPLVIAACEDGGRPGTAAVVGGDPDRGRAAVMSYGCGACHEIPGVPGADGTVGPPLRDAARKAYVAGVIPNRPEALVRWIMNPPAIDPRSAMPILDVGRGDAQDIAAYLYTVSQ